MSETDFNHPDQPPQLEPEPERLRAVLVYTRQHGWVIAEPERAQNGRTLYRVRSQTRRLLAAPQVLAVAELPPVPETAA